MKDEVLVDTSVWVLYLRTGRHGNVKTAVRDVLDRQDVRTCWVIKAELLVGARDDEAFENLAQRLAALPEVPIDASIWEGGARLGNRLRREGLLVPLPDLLIAQTAVAQNIALWHADEDFERIRQLVPLKTRNFLEQRAR